MAALCHCGIRVIHTPGHTPGHICLYLQQTKTLVGGDTLCIEDRKLSMLPKLASFDPPLAIKSLDKLVRYTIETVLCYHGGIWQGSTDQFTRELSDLK